jgi:hypothetical protein
MKLKVSVLYLFFLQFSLAQVQDSITVVNRDMHHHSESVSNSLRFGFGIQKSFQTEIGFARMNNIVGCTGFFSKAYYTSFEYSPEIKNNNDVFGFKAGCEANLSILAVALEAKYVTDFDVAKDFVIVPKIGFGIGYVNLMYGYAVSTNHHPFLSIGKHQISLIANLPLHTKNK